MVSKDRANYNTNHKPHKLAMNNTHPQEPSRHRASTDRLSRRSVIAGTGTAFTTALAGCLGTGLFDSTGAHDDVVLDKPADYSMLDGAELEHPIHGDEVPDIAVPDLVTGEEMSSHDFIGDRHMLLTFVFTRCPGACPALTASLLQVQANAAENGYSDDIALLEYTFDPEYDTETRFLEYAEEMNIDLNIGNWHFLRPETPASAEEVITDTFGVWFDELTDEQREGMEMHEDMAFQHENLILLVNKKGYVERAYEGEPPNPGTVVDDVNRLLDRW